MKIFVLSMATSFTFVACVQTQGDISFTNFQPAVGLNAPVFNVDGTPLEGDRYVAQLLGGPDAESMELVGDPVPFRVDGLFVGGVRSVPGPLISAEVAVKVLAWDTTTGTSFEEATVRGMSSVLNVRTFTPTTPPAALQDLESFSLVPEPQPWLFGLVGAGVLWGARRRQWAGMRQDC